MQSRSYEYHRSWSSSGSDRSCVTTKKTAFIATAIVALLSSLLSPLVHPVGDWKWSTLSVSPFSSVIFTDAQRLPVEGGGGTPTTASRRRRPFRRWRSFDDDDDEIATVKGLIDTIMEGNRNSNDDGHDVHRDLAMVRANKTTTAAASKEETPSLLSKSSYSYSSSSYTTRGSSTGEGFTDQDDDADMDLLFPEFSRGERKKKWEKKNKKEKEGGPVRDLSTAVKNSLPSNWIAAPADNFFDETERDDVVKAFEKAMEEVRSEIRETMREFPFPVRALEKMALPLASLGRMTSISMESGGGDEVWEAQEQSVDDALDRATTALNDDAVVRSVLGGPIAVGKPFSRRTSTTSINGDVTNQVHLSFPVKGASSSGTAHLSSCNGTIERLELKVNNSRRIIRVNLAD